MLTKVIFYKNNTYNQIQNKHIESVNYIKDNIAGNTIVLTHHLPSFKLITDKYKTYRNNTRYASDLESLMTKNVKYWICGHTHCQYETKINETFCKINAYGHSDECNKNNIAKMIYL